MIEWGLLSDAPRPIGLAAARVLHTKRKFVCTCVCKKTDVTHAFTMAIVTGTSQSRRHMAFEKVPQRLPCLPVARTNRLPSFNWFRDWLISGIIAILSAAQRWWRLQTGVSCHLPVIRFCWCFIGLPTAPILHQMFICHTWYPDSVRPSLGSRQAQDWPTVYPNFPNKLPVTNQSCIRDNLLERNAGRCGLPGAPWTADSRRFEIYPTGGQCECYINLNWILVHGLTTHYAMSY